MKTWFWVIFLLAVMATTSYGAYFPEAENKYVNDLAGVLTAQDKSSLRESLETLDRRAGIEMTLLTVRSLADYSALGVDFDTYAARLFDNWGIGDKTKNNGVLIFFSLDDRHVRIELGKGYRHYYDKDIQFIIDHHMLPRFKQGQYSQGLYDGTYAVINTVSKQVAWWSYYKWHLAAGALVVVCICAGVSCMNSGKKGWGYALFAAAAALALLLLGNVLRSRGSGGGGFGGGSSGGGGGSGSW